MWSCIWDTLKYHFGFWGAMALIGVLTVAIAGLTASTGGAATAGLTDIVTNALATTVGGIGASVAAGGGAGLIGTLVGGIAKCF